jgi:hypothetical protein
MVFVSNSHHYAFVNDICTVTPWGVKMKKSQVGISQKIF